ncbi:hypothetical protein MBM09_09860 [Flaviramulus sp. BrNp1-15]|uniref:hypothetical protein n=1 Tax=Flaviramulus sp. BrNp1-15 TaxID=2916754 RepID=UPI001EE8D958|nr:hypothetical protein [Flaviramulus sp. BrNp1-15]ULC58223.1 hypothetical protein MBM09_09860 [Flaviramulus sp. BrNp1-15]
MKNIIYVFAMLIFSTAMTQEKPTEVKEETKVKTIKYKDGDETAEKKVKVVTRETANVKLDKNDATKVNQDRVAATTKVEKMLMIDDDADSDYDTLSKVTYFMYGDNNYMFTPNSRGFDIAFDKDKEKFVNVGRALTTGAKGNYIISGEAYNGIGYFNTDGNFVIEYYNNDTDTIEVKVYERNKTNI